jgi:parallel beta-helix repeat protein
MKRGLIVLLLVVLFLGILGSVSALDLSKINERKLLPSQDIPTMPVPSMPSIKTIVPSTTAPAAPNALSCGGIPTDGCNITQNTVFSPGTYNLPNGIRLNTTFIGAITLDCNGATLVGNYGNTFFRVWEGYPNLKDFNLTIKNCIIKNYQNGITFTNGLNFNITNNTIINISYGSALSFTNGLNFNITNNTISNILYGNALALTNGNGFNSSIVNNKISNITGRGIELVGSLNDIVQGNTIIDGRDQNDVFAIVITDGFNHTVINNTIINFSYGVTMGSDNIPAEGGGPSTFNTGKNSTIKDNVFINNSLPIYVNSANIHIFRNTIISDNRGWGAMYLSVPFPQYQGRYQILFDDSQIINNTITGGTDGLVCEHRYLKIMSNTIKKVIPRPEYVVYEGRAINIVGCKNMWIENNTLSDSIDGVGINAFNLSNGTIIKNIIINNYYGVYLDNNQYSNITNNTVQSAFVGFVFSFAGKNNTIFNNAISNIDGAGIDFAFGAEPFNAVYQNTISNSGQHGIYLDFPWKDSKSGVSIYNNTLSDNAQCGIFLRTNATDINVFRNEIYNNVYGICNQFSSSNSIYKNNIHNNQLGMQFVSTSNNKVFLNSIYDNYGNPFNGVYGDVPQELSYQKQGNYWGHASPPCFNATDSNRADVNDSYPFCGSAPSTAVVIPMPSPGWYFFGSNGMPRNTSITKVLENIVGNPSDPNFDIVQYYINGLRKQYDPLIPLSSPVNSLKDILSWYGYWIKISSAPAGNNFVIASDKVAGSSPLALNVNQHWIGYWCESNKPTAAALTSLVGKYVNVKTYENGAWKTYDPALPQFSDLLEMKPGNAYLIKTNASGSLNYAC